MADIYTGLTAFKTALDVAKLIKDGYKTFDEAEMKLKMAELISILVDAKTDISLLQDEIIEQKNVIKDLKDKIEIKEKLTYEAPYYWLIDGENKDGPYCQLCYDRDEILIRLQENGKGSWRCYNCKNGFIDSNYESVMSRRKIIPQKNYY